MLSSRFRGLCTASATAISVTLLAAPAFAEDAAAGQPACTPDQAAAGTCVPAADASAPAASAPDADQGSIVVTGSRIRRPNLDSAIPITSLTGEDFFQQGQNNVGDTLNELPQLRTTFGQANAGRFLGTTGLNLLDLRGLGTQRTLVLVNGRRHVAGDILNNGVSPDVNTIPNDLIERVDIVTGGNSAIYGSDAIAGVVNFVLRHDYEGLQVRGQTGISEYGAGGNQYVAAMYGLNFADGRGNVTLHGEYAHQDKVYYSDVPYLQTVNGFLSIDSDPAGTPHGSDGIPDRVFFRDIRTRSNNFNSQIAFTQRAGQPGGPQCGTGINNTPYNCVFQFNADGQSLVQQTGSNVSTGPIGGVIGGNGTTGVEANMAVLLPRQDRYNFNLLGHYTFSPAFELFLEAKYVRVDTVGTNASPAFVQGSTIDGFRERVRLDNPFLTAAERTQITNLLLAYNTRPGLSTANGAPLSAGDLANIANGSFRVPIQRYFLDLGTRDEDSQRETYRGVIGLRGTFNDDWTYEVSANYGKVNEDTTILGNVDIARLLFAMDAGRNPATGQIQCRAQFDPAAQIDVIGDDAKLASDIAACVPYNPIGQQDNAAARAYIDHDTVSHATMDQFVLNAYVAGDSSQWFNLPGGPVGFALGAEYRREKLFYQADPFIEQGLSFYNALPTFSPEAFEVKEAFGEIRLPILADMPFFEQLSVSAAARVASYGGAAGTVWAYNGNIEWAPVRDIRFRANYGRSVRAPALTETSFPLTQNFSPAGFVDPCAPGARGATPNRAANCAADLGALLGNVADISRSLQIQSGSNPDLQSETSDSWTFGAVIQPRWIPGLSLTVDYYNITVNGVIAALSAQSIANSCYDAPDLNNQFCALFTRYRGTGPGPSGEIPGDILEGSLLQIPLNYAALKRRGIDFELAYRHGLGADTRIDARLIYTHNLQISNFTDASHPEFEDRIMTELGDPQDEFQLNVALSHGPVTFGYRMRYIGKQVLNFYEDFFPLETACTTNGCPPNNADYADRQFYPAVFYHDLRLNVDIGRDYSFYAGVDNVLGRNPPLGLSGAGAGSGIYNVRGRNYFAGFRARF